MKQRVSVFATAVLSLIVSLFGAVWVVNSFSRKTAVTGTIQMPSATPTPRTATVMGVMGNIAIPTPTPELRGDIVGKRVKPRAL